MLIFQLHLSHVIINSMQALHAPSHLRITFQKAQSHINMYCLKHSLKTKKCLLKDVLSSLSGHL